MRELARIQFHGDDEAFLAAWNARSGHKIKTGVISLYRDDPDYHLMKDLFATYQKEHKMVWHESVDAMYTNQELDAFELLTLYILGQAGEGDNSLTEVYETRVTCSICGRVNYRQIRDLVLDLSTKQEDLLETGYFKHDLCETDFGEIIVSGKVYALLQEAKVPEIILRPVQLLKARKSKRQPYFQLIVEAEIAPFVEPSRVQRLSLCTGCGQYTQVLLGVYPGRVGSEFYMPRRSYHGSWIARTEPLGRVPQMHSRIVINQTMYQLLKRNRITGFKVQPAHLVDG